jgi:FG-GAP-like repeat/Protein of unknown function (DUF1573)/FG-GAP repeat
LFDTCKNVRKNALQLREKLMTAKVSPLIHKNCRKILLVILVALISKLGNAGSVPAYAFGVGSFAVPEAPTDIAVGDFNGDGRLDLAVTSAYGLGYGMVSILLGRADGSFAPAVNYSVGPYGLPVTNVAVGDFNRDGKMDIVVVAYPSFQILFGNGDGTFQPGVGFHLSNGATGVVVGDFNKDGSPDLAFAIGGYNKPEVAVLLGKGNGTFAPEVDYATAGSSSVTTGDFNGDGKLDLAIGGGDAYLGVSVLWGNGDGTFGSYLATPIAPNGCGAIAVADLNHDQKSDVVCGAWQYYPGGVSVLVGKGDGTFTSPVFYPIQVVGNGPNVVAIADFNGDGKQDIVSANYDGYDTSVLLGNGDGTFKAAKNYPASINSVGVVTGDFNRDGIQDIAVLAGYNASALVTVLIGRGDGTFAGHVNQAIPNDPNSLATGDFNDDGKPDLAVTDSGNPGSASVLLNEGSGHPFQVNTDKVVTRALWDLSGDFNNDGHLDLVIVDVNSTGSSIFLTTLLGNGNGTLQSPLNLTLSSFPAGQSTVADFNLDGKLDLATCLQNQTGPSVFLGKGDGTFESPTFFDVGGLCGDPGPAFSADLNGDHKPDLLVSTYNGISVLLGNGNGTFGPASNILPGDSLIGVGDFNRDGKPDLVVFFGSPYIGIALGNGDGTFRAPQTVFVTALLIPERTVVGDFNGDGKLDIAFKSSSPQILSILLGNGDGTFGERIDLPTENSPWSLTAADFSGAGGIDIAVGNATFKGNGTLSLFSNRPVGALYPSPLQFGSISVGSTKTLSTTLYNSGGAPLVISAVTVSGEYLQTHTCGSTLAVGSSCKVVVTFKPTGTGQHSGQLTIRDNATTKPQIVNLVGTGVK